MLTPTSIIRMVYLSQSFGNITVKNVQANSNQNLGAGIVSGQS